MRSIRRNQLGSQSMQQVVQNQKLDNSGKLTENMTKAKLNMNARNLIGMKKPLVRNYPMSLQRLQNAAKVQVNAP